MSITHDLYSSLDPLCQHEGDGPTISAYVEIDSGDAKEKNEIRWKNRHREAAHQLEAQKIDPERVEALLAPLNDALEDVGEDAAVEGLGVFAAEGVFHRVAVPVDKDGSTWVGPHFYVRPLFDAARTLSTGFVLSLSQGLVQLHRLWGDRMTEIALNDTPLSLEDAVGRELTEQALQSHSGGAGAWGTAIFHGQGGGVDDVKPEIRKFFSMVDRSVTSVVGKSRSHVILAGTDRMVAMYRGLSELDHIAEEFIPGSPDGLPSGDLLTGAKSALASLQTKTNAAAGSQLDEALGQSGATQKIDEVVLAAMDGRIDTLFITRDEKTWGSVDLGRREVSSSSEQDGMAEELVNLAAVYTHRNGGSVCVLDELPADEHVAAILRH